MSELAVGLAGLGVHGSRYAEHLLRGEVSGARLAAVCRGDADAGGRFAAEHGVDFVADPRELATRPGVDAVVAVLPPDLHAGVARACLEAGRPALVEKPLAADARSAGEIVRLARRSPAPLMVAHTLRFDAVVEAVRREIPGLGALRLLAINQRFEPLTRTWIDQPGRGGALLNTGVHAFDLLRWLTGAEPLTVYAETSSFVTRHTEDQFACVVRLEPGGILATVDNSRTTRGRTGRIEVVGEHGQLRADHVLRTVVRVRERREVDLGPVEPRMTVLEALRSFVACVREGRPPAITAGDGCAAVELAEACRLSAREGRRVRLEEVREGAGGSA